MRQSTQVLTPCYAMGIAFNENHPPPHLLCRPFLFFLLPNRFLSLSKAFLSSLALEAHGPVLRHSIELVGWSIDLIPALTQSGGFRSVYYSLQRQPGPTTINEPLVIPASTGLHVVALTSSLQYTLGSVGICWRSSICSIGSLLFFCVPSLEVGSCLPCFFSLYSVAGILPEYTVADALYHRNHRSRYIPKRVGEFVLVLVLMSFFSGSSFVPQTLVLELAI